MTILLLFVLVSSTLIVSAEPIEISVLNNDGLTKFTSHNYTFNCEHANSNILTIIIHESQAQSYLTVTHINDNVWVSESFNLLDARDDVYNIQFTSNGLYRLRITRLEENSSYRDFYIEVLNGDGTYAGGDVEILIEKGRWVDDMMNIFGRTWPEFKTWALTAFRFFTNPIYVLTDFLIEIPMFLLMPQTWLIIAIVVLVLLMRMRRRIFITRKDRELSKTHGTRTDLIREKRRAEEETRLHKLNTMPIDYALEKYGSGDYLSRSMCYHMGVPAIGVTYPSAYSLSFELGGSIFSTNEISRKRGLEILNALVEEHEPILEKAYIYQDMANCARAVSAESVESGARTVIKDSFIRIAELAEEEAKIETAELSKKLKVKVKSEKPLADTIVNLEKSVKKVVNKK